jgi:hypothetical protein
MAPSEAYELLEAIAIISGSQDKLQKVKENDKTVDAENNRTKRPPINFSKCGIPVGAELIYTEDSSVKVIVESERKVLYNGEITLLSAVVGRLKGVKSVQGPSYFTYNSKLLIEIAEQTQWKN